MRGIAACVSVNLSGSVKIQNVNPRILAVFTVMKLFVNKSFCVNITSRQGKELDVF